MDFLREKLPAPLMGHLAGFQKLGVAWGAKKMGGRCLIADEPGLGKTIQAIGVAYCCKFDKKRRLKATRLSVIAIHVCAARLSDCAAFYLDRQCDAH